MIISNTSPLYYLHQIGHIRLLNDLFGVVCTTSQVVAELDAGVRQGLSIPDIRSNDSFKIQDISFPPFLELIPDLGYGEASVIALALENKGSLAIIDDSLGRSVALSQKIKLTGTLGILLLAKEDGLIASLSPLVADLRKNGFYCSKKLVDDVLRIANESP